MSNLFKKCLLKRLEDYYTENDRLKIGDVEKELREMGYEPEEGSKKSVLTFWFGDVYHVVRYENYWLDIRMYLLEDNLEYFELYKQASERVNNEIAMIKSCTKMQENGVYFAIFKCDVFITSAREFKKVFPLYLKEVKDGCEWFKIHFNKMKDDLKIVEALKELADGDDNPCNESEY